MWTERNRLEKNGHDLLFKWTTGIQDPNLGCVVLRSPLYGVKRLRLEWMMISCDGS